jgi:hypothetical protein
MERVLYKKPHNLYSLYEIFRVIKSRRIRWMGDVAHTGEMRNAYIILVGRPEEKRPFGRCRFRTEDDVRMDLRERCGLDASGSG